MRLIISHFFNESYLLPWWLNHHSPMFDHGILIDYHSTDDSVEICRRLVPGWEIISSENESFDALLCDFEVMKHESRYPDAWKLALNTTEFLVTNFIDDFERSLLDRKLTGAIIPGAIMVDAFPEDEPEQSRSLVEQKNWGIWEDEVNLEQLALPGLNFPTRGRIYHRYSIGAYAPGRHSSHLPGQQRVLSDEAAIWWYGFSPWSDKFKARKLQIGEKRGEFDVKFKFGVQHEASVTELETRRRLLLTRSACLRSKKVIQQETERRSSYTIAKLEEQIDKLNAELRSLQKEAAEKVKAADVEFRRLSDENLKIIQKFKEEAAASKFAWDLKEQTLAKLALAISDISARYAAIRRLRVSGDLFRFLGTHRLTNGPAKRDVDKISKSAFFDAAFYVANNPDVSAAGLDPVVHYLTHGGFEGRDPGPWFSTAKYLEENPDVAAAQMNALLHYERYGRVEGRSCPLT